MASGINMRKIAAGSLAASLGMYLLARTQTDDVTRDVAFLFTCVLDGFFVLINRIFRQIKTLRKVKELSQRPVWSVVDMFNEIVQAMPQKVALRFVTEEDQIVDMTFKELDERSNQVANFLRSQGLRKLKILTKLFTYFRLQRWRRCLFDDGKS